MAEVMNEVTDVDNLVLTTIDNPFNPKENYASWKTWDESNGYYTEAYVARVADIPVDMDLDDDILIDQMTMKAYESILDNDVLGVYLLV